MTLTELNETLADINALQAYVKQCAMIYDYSRKCHIAHVYGLQEQTLFGMDFQNYRYWLDRYMEQIYTRPELPA